LCQTIFKDAGQRSRILHIRNIPLTARNPQWEKIGLFSIRYGLLGAGNGDEWASCFIQF